MKTLITPYRHFFERIISYALMLLFVYAATTKLLEWHMFYDTLLNSPWVPGSTLALVLAIGIIITELLIALGLLLHYRWSLYGSLFLLVVFTAYVSYLLLRDSPLPCSCGGVLSLLSWPQHLYFNSFWILMTLLGLRLYPKT